MTTPFQTPEQLTDAILQDAVNMGLVSDVAPGTVLASKPYQDLIADAYDPTPSDLLTPAPVVTSNGIEDISALVSKTILVRIKFGTIGNSKKVAGSAVLTTDADVSLLKVSKQLLDSSQLNAISKADQQMRKWIYNTCLPFDSGLMLLPIGLINQATAKLKEYEIERKQLVEAFIGVYPSLQADAEKHLGSLYSPFDYPHIDTIKAKFTFSWGYVSLGTPDALKHISAELYEQEQKKFGEQYAVATEEITTLMRTMLYEAVKHLQDKLTPGDDGKVKILRESAITNVQEFLNSFDLRNVTNDKELEAIVAKARSLLTGTSAATIKSSDEFRSTLLEGMESISASLSGMIVIKPGRKFRDEDEGEAVVVTETADAYVVN